MRNGAYLYNLPPILLLMGKQLFETTFLRRTGELARANLPTLKRIPVRGKDLEVVCIVEIPFDGGEPM